MYTYQYMNRTCDSYHVYVLFPAIVLVVPSLHFALHNSHLSRIKIIFIPNFGKDFSILTCAYFSDGLVKKHQLVYDLSYLKRGESMDNWQLGLFHPHQWKLYKGPPESHKTLWSGESSVSLENWSLYKSTSINMFLQERNPKEWNFKTE